MAMKIITESNAESRFFAPALGILGSLLIAAFFAVAINHDQKVSSKSVDATRVMTNHQIVGKCRNVADHCIGSFVTWGDASPVWRISLCEPSCGTAEVRLSELGLEPKYNLARIDIVLRSDSRWDYVSERFKDQYIRPFNPYSER